MTQQPIEIILMRRWAAALTIPVFLASSEGDMLYFNGPAATLLGKPYEDTGALPLGELAELFEVRDVDDEPMQAHQIPLGIALMRRKPAHGRIRFRGFDGSWHLIDVTAVPLEGHGDTFIGAVAFFWEVAE